jgi:hypothetical protein
MGNLQHVLQVGSSKSKICTVLKVCQKDKSNKKNKLQNSHYYRIPLVSSLNIAYDTFRGQANRKIHSHKLEKHTAYHPQLCY